MTCQHWAPGQLFTIIMELTGKKLREYLRKLIWTLDVTITRPDGLSILYFFFLITVIDIFLFNVKFMRCS